MSMVHLNSATRLTTGLLVAAVGACVGCSGPSRYEVSGPVRAIGPEAFRGEVPAQIVHQDDQALAFRDANPQAPVHILVIPRKPIARLDEAQPGDAALLGHPCLVASKVAREAGLSDWRLVVNVGPGVGQSVFHLHLHVLGGRPFSWPPG